AEDGIRDDLVTGVQTCALPISVAEPGMPAVAVVPALDPVEGRRPRLLLGAERAPAEELLLERGVEALADGVVVAVAPRAHRLREIGRASCRERGEESGDEGPSK